MKAVVEPKYMQPRIVERTAQNTIEFAGFLRWGLTFPKKVENGVARSLARVQNIRLAVKCTPRMPTKSGRNMTTSSPTVPEEEPVACS